MIFNYENMVYLNWSIVLDAPKSVEHEPLLFSIPPQTKVTFA